MAEKTAQSKPRQATEAETLASEERRRKEKAAYDAMTPEAKKAYWEKNYAESLPAMEEKRKAGNRTGIAQQTYNAFMQDHGRPPTKKEMEDAMAAYNTAQTLKYVATGGLGFLFDAATGNENREAFAMMPETERDFYNTVNAAGEAIGPLIAPEAYARDYAARAKPAFASKLDPRFADLQFLAAERARQRQAPTMNQAPQLQQRANQIQLLQQLEGSRGQDTVAKLQGQKALGEAAYRGAQRQATGGGLAEATEATRQSQGIVAQVGEGAVSQDYATRNMQNLLSTQGRGQDFQATQAQNRLGLAQQESNNAMVKFYQTLGDDFETAQRRANTEFIKLERGVTNRFKQASQEFRDSAIGAVGTLVAMG